YWRGIIWTKQARALRPWPAAGCIFGRAGTSSAWENKSEVLGRSRGHETHFCSPDSEASKNESRDLDSYFRKPRLLVVRLPRRLNDFDLGRLFQFLRRIALDEVTGDRFIGGDCRR